MPPLSLNLNMVAVHAFSFFRYQLEHFSLLLHFSSLKQFQPQFNLRSLYVVNLPSAIAVALTRFTIALEM
jgi:hypothetical protein